MPTARDNTFKLWTIDDIEQLAEPDWLIDGFIPVGGFVNLCGPPKSGKSFIGLDWALSVASGQPWLGHQVQQGPVVYIYAETPAGLKRRVPAWSAAHDGARPEDFRALPARVNITNVIERERLIKSIEASDVTPVMIVIDTLAKCFGTGDENSAKDMNAFVDGCECLRERFGCSVVVVHHTGKEVNKGSRGSTALPGAVDGQFQVRKLANGKLRLTNELQRDEREQPDMWLALVPSLNSVVLVRTDGPKGEAEKQKAPSKRETVIAALRAFMPAGASDLEWKNAAIAAGTAERSFYRFKRALIKEGLAVEREGAWVLVEPIGANAPTDDIMSHVPQPKAQPECNANGGPSVGQRHADCQLPKLPKPPKGVGTGRAGSAQRLHFTSSYRSTLTH